ncbi:MAG: hypothetical protein ACFFCW_04315 [Candidatus Hodarchaeota archaeon]
MCEELERVRGGLSGNGGTLQAQASRGEGGIRDGWEAREGRREEVVECL